MADLRDPKAEPVSRWLAGLMLVVACALVGISFLFNELDCSVPKSNPLCYLLESVPSSPPKQELIPIPEVVQQPSSTSITLVGLLTARKFATLMGLGNFEQTTYPRYYVRHSLHTTV